MKLLEAKHVHFVGIKGVAQTALALCLSDAGIEITGSDVEEEFVTEPVLRSRSFKIFASFSPEHITDQIDLVVYTGAHQGENNAEVVAAKKKGITCFSHAEALGQLVMGKRLISVCGTGGKSTTSAMAAWILEKAGLRPSFAVGVGNIPNFGVPGRYVPDSDWFVAEADEYAVDPTGDLRPRFIFQHPEVIICTNLKYDHPDVYLNFDKTKEVFLDFFNSLPDTGLLVINGDDEDLISLTKRLKTKAKVQKIGTLSTNDCYLHDIVTGNGRSQSMVACKRHEPSSLRNELVDLTIPGTFNLMNAEMAVTAASYAGVKESESLAAMSEFKGTMRRFELKSEVGKPLWYDDYAHTPPEIEATLTALKSWQPDKKIIAVFQPHTYSRTKALFSGFSRSFTVADEIVLLPIFASAREAADQSISSEMLAESIESQGKKGRVKSMKSRDEAAQYLVSLVRPENIIITLGAGDVYKLFDEVMQKI